MKTLATHIAALQAAPAISRAGRVSPEFTIRTVVSILFGLLLVTAAAFAQVETRAGRGDGNR